MTLRKFPSPAVTAQSIVYDTPSGMGGTFTVQVVAEDGARRLVQTIYGTIDAATGRFKRWDDCLEFWTTAERLTNRRAFRKEA
jgi:hypothetical protein